jgi:hypothetical protein
MICPLYWLCYRHNNLASSCDNRRPIIAFGTCFSVFLSSSWPSVNAPFIQPSKAGPHPGMNKGWGWLDDDRDLIVVAVAEPVEGGG